MRRTTRAGSSPEWAGFCVTGGSLGETGGGLKKRLLNNCQISNDVMAAIAVEFKSKKSAQLRKSIKVPIARELAGWIAHPNGG
jgi:hypothetical protein